MNEDSAVWSDAYSVGMTEIDDQHKELVKMTNDLFISSSEGGFAADKAFLQTAKKASDYARVHFSFEEDILKKAAYPEFDAHKKQHTDFLETVLKSVQEFESGKMAGIEMARFLKKWLLNHIAVCDKHYASFLGKI